MAAMPVILATGGYDHKIRFWDATSGVCTKFLSFPESQVNCLHISTDKSAIAAGGNPLIHVFDVNHSDERPIMTYEGHLGNVMAVGFQNNKKWLYSASEDGTVRIWDSRSNRCTRKYDCGAPVNTVALDPNQAALISGDQNGSIKVWDLEADKCREEYVPATDVPVRSISMACDASFFTAGLHDGRLVLYNQAGNSKSWELGKEFSAHSDYLLKCLISPNLQIIATTSADRTIKLWDSGSFDLIRTLNRHQRWVWDCVFSADSLYLLSASSDHSAKLWDLSNGDVIRNYVGHNLAVTCVALNDIALS